MGRPLYRLVHRLHLRGCLGDLVVPEEVERVFTRWLRRRRGREAAQGCRMAPLHGPEWDALVPGHGDTASDASLRCLGGSWSDDDGGYQRLLLVSGSHR